MTDFGIIDTGFAKKTLEEILTELKADELDEISPDLNLLSTSILGQLNGIFGDKIRELWDLAEAVYRATYPDSASGEALEQLAALTGVERLAATKSAVTLDGLYLDAGVTVPAGSIVSVGTDGTRYVTLEDVINAAGYRATVSVEVEAEETGPNVGYAHTIDTIQTPVTGWSTKPALTAANAGDYDLDTKTLTFSVDGAAPATLLFLPAKSRLWTIAEAVAAFSGVVGEVAYNCGGKLRLGTDTSQGSIEITGGTANTAFGFTLGLVKGLNSEDADIGTDIETDPALRLRREQLLRVLGAATVEAIRAAVLTVEDVIQTFVFENVTMVEDGDGLPAKSFEVVVQGGSPDNDQAIADKIWEVKPAGIEAHGDVSKTVTDSQGIDHTMKFTRPTPVPVAIDCLLIVDAATFPADGVEQVEVVLKALGDEQEVGEDVIAIRFNAAPLAVSGVLDVDVDDFFIYKKGEAQTNENIDIEKREIATFDVDDIVVSVA